MSYTIKLTIGKVILIQFVAIYIVLSSELPKSSKSKCGQGFEKNLNGTCKPNCKASCLNGECIAPNKCKCNAGYLGNRCADKCLTGYYGENCEQHCNLSRDKDSHKYCDHITGKVYCHDGYMGSKCQTRCESGRYGWNCSRSCNCAYENQLCDGITGECTCPSGQTGINCSESCPEYAYGSDCKKECKCVNNATCNSQDGSCKCESGWSGQFCEEPCRNRTYGPHCSQQCPNITAASHVTNLTCNPHMGYVCEPGYTGDSCDEVCPLGHYGENCQKICSCQEMESCSPITGRCLPGWSETTSQTTSNFSVTPVTVQLNQTKEDTSTESEPISSTYYFIILSILITFALLSCILVGVVLYRKLVKSNEQLSQNDSIELDHLNFQSNSNRTQNIYNQ